MYIFEHSIFSEMFKTPVDTLYTAYSYYSCVQLNVSDVFFGTVEVK